MKLQNKQRIHSAKTKNPSRNKSISHRYLTSTRKYTAKKNK